MTCNYCYFAVMRATGNYCYFAVIKATRQMANGVHAATIQRRFVKLHAPHRFFLIK
jgi:hypothetical protein